MSNTLLFVTKYTKSYDNSCFFYFRAYLKEINFRRYYFLRILRFFGRSAKFVLLFSPWNESIWFFFLRFFLTRFQSYSKGIISNIRTNYSDLVSASGSFAKICESFAIIILDANPTYLVRQIYIYIYMFGVPYSKKLKVGR